MEREYAGTTMTAVATAAGVSVQSVYKAFGTKPAPVKRAYDVTLAGDEEPVPIRERPQVRAMLADPDPRRKLAHHAALVGAGGVARHLVEVGALRPGLDVDRARDEYEARLAAALAAAALA